MNHRDDGPDQGLDSSTVHNIFSSTRLLLIFLVITLSIVDVLRTNSSTPDRVFEFGTWLILGGEGDGGYEDGDGAQMSFGESSSASEVKTPPTTRVLYMLSSSSKVHGEEEGDRIEGILMPVLLDGVESFLDTKPSDPRSYQVDVYLILSYNLTNSQHRRIRSLLPNSVGLQIWEDADPLDYEECDQNLDDADIIKDKKRWNETVCYRGPLPELGLIPIQIGLARQHRYVLKDKFSYYDIFISLEDDMRVMRHHVETHLRVKKDMAKLNVSDSPISPSQLARIHPGFARVEVLQDVEAEKRVLSIKKKESTVARKIRLAKGAHIDPSICCESNRIGNQRSTAEGLNKTSPTTVNRNDVIAWEIGIQGFGVVELGGKWYVAMPGTHNDPLPNYWSGNVLAKKYSKNGKRFTSLENRPRAGDPIFLGQPASWIMTREEIFQAHNETCYGGFLPPFDPKHSFNRDGNEFSVEYWSGGLQMWLGDCSMLRVMELDRFSHHFVYHTSNNKQIDIQDVQRLTRVNELYAQLQTVVKHATVAKNKGEKENKPYSYLKGEEAEA